VPAAQTIPAVKLREPARGLFRDKIRPQARAIAGERAADNLLHLSLVQINARPEHAINLKFRD